MIGQAFLGALAGILIGPTPLIAWYVISERRDSRCATPADSQPDDVILRIQLPEGERFITLDDLRALVEEGYRAGVPGEQIIGGRRDSVSGG